MCMKIATYNVRNLYDAGTFIDDKATEPVTESFFNERVSYFTSVFRTLDLDIICLQEVGGEKAITTIGDTLGYGYFFAKPNRRGIRMAVLYKKELQSILHCESVSLGNLYIPSIQVHGDTATLPPLSLSRDILEITILINEKIVSINTFHLKSNLPQYLEGDDTENDANAFTDAKFRCIFYKTMELCALRRHVTSRLQNGKQVILLGDYNENNTASLMDILKASRYKEELQLHDLLLGYTEDTTTHIHQGGRLTFDTIFASQGIKEIATSIHVLNKDLVDCSQLPLDALVVGSDHALVYMEIM